MVCFLGRHEDRVEKEGLFRCVKLLARAGVVGDVNIVLGQHGVRFESPYEDPQPKAVRAY